jgi:hypothetical protein
MANFETLEQEALCPCGQGRVHRLVYSPNYPFGRTSTSDAVIQCGVCQPVWQLGTTHQQMFHQERYQWPGKTAREQAYAMYSKLLTTVRGHQERVLLQYLHSKGARSKAAQHRVLQANNLYAASYQSYLRGGFKSVISVFDAGQIPECSATLEQLNNTKRAIEELNKDHRSWLEERRHRVEFNVNWKFC